jgi:hypothetical protein
MSFIERKDMYNCSFLLYGIIIIIIIVSEISLWKNGIPFPTTLYCFVIVAGEQMHKLRSFVLPARSIIV